MRGSRWATVRVALARPVAVGLVLALSAGCGSSSNSSNSSAENPDTQGATNDSASLRWEWTAGGTSYVGKADLSILEVTDFSGNSDMFCETYYSWYREPPAGQRDIQFLLSMSTDAPLNLRPSDLEGSSLYLVDTTGTVHGTQSACGPAELPRFWSTASLERRKTLAAGESIQGWVRARIPSGLPLSDLTLVYEYGYFTGDGVPNQVVARIPLD